MKALKTLALGGLFAVVALASSALAYNFEESTAYPGVQYGEASHACGHPCVHAAPAVIRPLVTTQTTSSPTTITIPAIKTVTTTTVIRPNLPEAQPPMVSAPVYRQQPSCAYSAAPAYSYPVAAPRVVVPPVYNNYAYPAGVQMQPPFAVSPYGAYGNSNPRGSYIRYRGYIHY